MGEKVTGNIGGTSTEGTNGTTGGTSTSTNTTSPSNSRGRGRPPKNGESDQKIPRLVSVEVPGTEESKEAPKGKRGRPAGNAKKKAAPKKADHTQISMLLITVSGIMASRKGMEPFALSMEEANQIAVPLSNIMAKNEAVAGIAGEYADHIALLFACMTIFIPKYLIWRAMNPKQEKKGENKNNVQPIRPATTGNNEKGPTPGSDKPFNGRSANTSNVASFNGDLSSILPPIAGI
jgi:hypothetical protein